VDNKVNNQEVINNNKEVNPNQANNNHKLNNNLLSHNLSKLKYKKSDILRSLKTRLTREQPT